MELMPDCHDTLTRLKTMGFYLAAVSNADEDQLQPLVERGQLNQWLTHWTSSEVAQSCKPDLRFFEVALKKSGLAADEVMFVGDSPEQDILGAHAMGMTTVLITEADRHAPMHIGRKTPEPNFTIAGLSELPGIVERLGRSTAPDR
jgi:HAD superfamily hydrolase (TIGR01509 family)